MLIPNYHPKHAPPQINFFAKYTQKNGQMFFSTVKFFLYLNLNEENFQK